ncbi:Hint domain-containing protein [Sorangium sp. So ce513]|uniref:Hint domain-containing protein n=1 Tax=Sorangium sp. So ce513 TaxID=3133315 RepID=UPI003F60DD72
MHPGDLVMADDPEDNEGSRIQEVTEVHDTAAYRIFYIEVAGKNGGEIRATGRHPFWTTRSWVATEELTTDDLLQDEFGRHLEIASISVESRDTPTFNLSVAGDHTFFVVAGGTSVLVHNVDPWEIMYSQSSYASTFADGPWAGRTIMEAIAEARRLDRVPDGLTLNAMRMGDGTWVALNSRTLAVARGANLSNVNPVEAGASGLNKLRQPLRNSSLVGLVEGAVMRCK